MLREGCFFTPSGACLRSITPNTAFRTIGYAALAGALLSLYLLVHHIQLRKGYSAGSSFCSFNRYINCDQVALSGFSEFLGIPVAGYGLFYFFSLLLLLKFVKEEKKSEPVWAMLKVVGFCGVLPIVILASISLTLIGSICIFCVGTYLCALIIATVSFRAEPAPQRFLRVGISKLTDLLRNNPSLLGLLMLAGVCSLAAPVGILYLSGVSEESAKRQGQMQLAVAEWKSAPIQNIALSLVREGDDRDVILGDTTAGVTIVTYSDFGCPHCKLIATELDKLLEEGGIQVIFKDYPLDQHCNPAVPRRFHEYSCQAAKVSRCALRTSEGKFAATHRALYALPELTRLGLESIQTNVETSSVAAANCLKESGYPESLSRHIQQGNEIPIEGTPAIFVNGKRLSLPTVEALRAIIQISMSQKDGYKN